MTDLAPTVNDFLSFSILGQGIGWFWPVNQNKKKEPEFFILTPAAFLLPCCAYPLNPVPFPFFPYFTTAPSGSSPSTVTSFNTPPREAASSIPWDSTPRTMAGFKFATTTMVRPGNSSGV